MVTFSIFILIHEYHRIKYHIVILISLHKNVVKGTSSFVQEQAYKFVEKSIKLLMTS